VLGPEYVGHCWSADSVAVSFEVPLDEYTVATTIGSELSSARARGPEDPRRLAAIASANTNRRPGKIPGRRLAGR
jgi:hypothetical protein